MMPRRGGLSSTIVVCGASEGSWKSPEMLASIWKRLSAVRFDRLALAEGRAGPIRLRGAP